MPPEVQELQDAITSIPGITDAAMDKVDLSDVTESDFSLLPYADLPLGALKRTKGGLDNELAISVNFGITRDPQGLKALGAHFLVGTRFGASGRADADQERCASTHRRSVWHVTSLLHRLFLR